MNTQSFFYNSHRICIYLKMDNESLKKLLDKQVSL